jgi:hypothetical protein
MKEDDFEHELQLQQFREIPDQWREEIISSARQVCKLESQRAKTKEQVRVTLLSLRSRLSTLFWPSQKAWAGLASIWLLIGVVNIKTAGTAKIVFLPTRQEPLGEMMSAWKDQEKLLTELVELHDSTAVEPPKRFAPKPRSELDDQCRII